MMWMFLCLPLWGLELVIIPIIAWYVADPGWHPYLAVAGAVALIASIGFAVRSILRNRTSANVLAATRNECIWRPGTPSSAFKTELELFLKLRGWRIASAMVGSHDRIAVVAGKDRFRIALLLLPPTSRRQTPEDLSNLRGIMRAASATRSAVICVQPDTFGRTGSEKTDVQTLRFRDLAKLEDAMQLWS